MRGGGFRPRFAGLMRRRPTRWQRRSRRCLPPRPIAPSPSARFAFTLTGAPTALDSRVLHLHATRGELRAPRRSPCSRRFRAASPLLAPSRPPARAARSSRLLSIEGRCRGSASPMSPSPAAPRSASVTAWATTSASLWPRSGHARELNAAEHEQAIGIRVEWMHVEALADTDRHQRTVTRKQPGRRVS